MNIKNIRKQLHGKKTLSKYTSPLETSIHRVQNITLESDVKMFTDKIVRYITIEYLDYEGNKQTHTITLFCDKIEEVKA